MKNKPGTLIVTCLTAVVLMTSGMAFGETLLTTTLRTDKTFYLMDPFHWVYTAPSAVWPDEGHPRSVTFNVNIYDKIGFPAEVTDVSFEVYDNEELFASGDVLPTGTLGSYEGSFELNEANLGADTFSGQVPKELSLKISTVANGLIKEHPVSVGRWGCDRCHVEAGLGKELYTWIVADLPFGPHTWGNILGASRPSAFDISYLTDAEKTHTPAALNVLDTFPFHEKTKRKYSIVNCSPCHVGSGHVRYPVNDGSGDPLYVSYAKSEAVECTFCHGIDGGYVPASGLWVDNAGYISAGHRHENVPLFPDTPRDPYLARQTCSNSGCHGHIEDDAEGEIHHNKPNCRDCHGIHNDDF